MCASISTIDTLRRVFKCSNLYSKMSFLSSDKQAALFSKLKEDDGSLYAGLEETCRTIFLRQTRDNYRSFRLPTQQMLLNIMNLTSLLNSPLGQFVQCFWRGQESRENIVAHCTALFAELKLVKQFYH